MVRVCATAFVLLSLLTGLLFHSGKTDSNGGHYDQSNGTYHYHHGYPAHQHRDTNGDGKPDCPYNFKNMTSDSGGGVYFDQDDSYSDIYVQEEKEANSSGAAFWTIILIVAFVSASSTALLLVDQKKKYPDPTYRVQALQKEIQAIVRQKPDLAGVSAPRCNYVQIDDTIQKERAIQQCAAEARSLYESEANRTRSTTKKIALIHAISVTLFFTLFLHRTFISGDVWTSLVFSLVISAVDLAVVGARMASGFAEQDSHAQKQFKEEAQKASRDLREKLTGSYADRRKFLGIPDNVRFVGDYPTDAAEDNRLIPYGTMTRFVSVSTGKRFHALYGCSGATFPVHLYQALLGNRYSYCSRCATSDANTAPDWYVYHLKLQKLEADPT